MSSGCWLRCHLIGDTLVRRRQVEHVQAPAFVANLVSRPLGELLGAMPVGLGAAVRVAIGHAPRFSIDAAADLLLTLAVRRRPCGMRCTGSTRFYWCGRRDSNPHG